MTTSAIRTPVPSIETASTPVRSPFFGFALVLALVALFASNGLAQAPAFSEAELRQLKHGVSIPVVANVSVDFTANELRDLRYEARTFGIVTVRPFSTFGFTPAELADLRGEAVASEPTYAPVAVTARELHDLRSEARARSFASARSAIGGFTATELHDLRTEARTFAALHVFAAAPVEAFTAQELSDLRHLAKTEPTSSSSTVLANR